MRASPSAPASARARPAPVHTTAAVALVALAACKVREPPPIESSYLDSFDRRSIGADYNRTGSGYRIVDGALNAKGAHNHPLWLAKRLPAGDIQIDFDAWSTSPDGDIKVEVFGDGRSYDADGGRYLSTGYVVVFGGWKNTKSILARRDEHGTEMAARTQPRVVPDRHYHWRIVRHQSTLTWYVDDMDQPFLTYVDHQPLVGPGHQYFAFDNWEADTWFDNLLVKKL